jgi:7,8-dihydropterin-6-yl-methyl-4-(beta-D-ribofuranosyl)aminobenzene 5'-phosphate synthase
MKATILYDNTRYRKGLQVDWGFSCMVQGEGIPTILFDTGTNGQILLSNMRKLDINPKMIDIVFISHAHFDHTGGLRSFRAENTKAKVYTPPTFYDTRNENMNIVQGPTEIYKNVFSTGELDRIEQSMVVHTSRGGVLFMGCSHPRMHTILSTASRFDTIYAIIGGLHGFRDFILFKDLALICPTHCTQHKAELKRLYPEKYLEGGVGRVIEII